MQYEYELDGIRAMAVMAVLLFHLGLKTFTGGFTGVDVFFVLSGYLITAISVKSFNKGDFSFSKFYIRRARRLLPSLFVVIFLSFVFSVLLMSPDHLAAFSRSAINATLSISNFGFWLESGYFDSNKYTKPLLHTWSLGVEEQFYLIWPVVIFLIFKLKNPNLRIFAMLSLVIISFLISLIFTKSNPNAAFFLSPFRAWQFASGGLLALFLHSHSELGRKYILPNIVSIVLTILGVVLTVWGFIYLTPENFPGVKALVPTIGTLFIILAGGNTISKLLLANRVTRFLGKHSYSLYLVHWPLIVFWRYYTGGPLNAYEIVIVGALSIFGAVLLYKFVETPFRKPWTRNFDVEKFAVPAGLLTTACVLLVFSSYAWAQQGWPGRVSDQSTELFAALKTSNKGVACHPKTAKQRGCYFGQRKQKPDFAIFGDSHAESLSLGLETLAKRKKKKGRKVVLYATLPFIDSVTYDEDKKLNRSFSRFLNSAATSDSDVVIIHARFALHWLTERPAYEAHMPSKFVGREGKSPPTSAAESQENFVIGLEETLKFLKSKKVVIVGAIPYQGVDTAQCLTRPTFIISQEKLINNCSGFSRDQVFQRLDDVNSILKSYAEKHGAIFIDPTETFCPKRSPNCIRVKDNTLLYKDDDHLSRAGATLLAKEIFSELGW